MTYRGLTWDHPRGYDALAETARIVNAGRPEPLITWDKQPLEGFESAPISDLAARYDLIVLDHPHIGEAVAKQCLIPLEDLFDPDQIAGWAAQSVGPAFRSYGWAGRHWALPLDVASQVMARRADLVAVAPTNWDEVEAMAARQPVALSLAGPHAVLNLISMAGGAGVVIGGDDMLPDEVALPAIARLGRLARQAPPATRDLNPIGLLDAMAKGTDIVLIPLVFGYVTYARAAASRHPIRFSNSIASTGGRGGVLGGTGIAFSARATPSPDLLEHVASLLSPKTQCTLLPAHNGQPSARAAWQSAKVNAVWGDFYSGTLASSETALLRPRFDGFPAFTNTASARLRDGLFRGEAPETTFAALRALWAAARARANGPLDDDRD